MPYSAFWPIRFLGSSLPVFVSKSQKVTRICARNLTRLRLLPNRLHARQTVWDIGEPKCVRCVKLSLMAGENDLLETPPRFPRPVAQRDVAGRHYLTKTELNTLYFATHRMRRPRGWSDSLSAGSYWRSAIVLFFNYGLDSGTVWGTNACHRPILWTNVSWDRTAPSREIKQKSKWGWISYRRAKNGKMFCRPMNRYVHARGPRPFEFHTRFLASRTM